MASERPEQPKLWKVAFFKDGTEMVEKPGLTWSNESHQAEMSRKYKLVDPTTTFIARLRVQSHRTSPSNSTHIYWECIESGTIYPSFFSSYVAAVMRANLDEGVIAGEWGYEKRGPRQGIRLIEELDI